MKRGISTKCRDEEAERHAMLERSSETDLEKTEEEILKQFNCELDCVPSALKQTLPSEPTEEYWTAQYYEALRKVHKTEDHDTAMEPAPRTPVGRQIPTIVQSPSPYQETRMDDHNSSPSTN